jgi:tRNA G37 N-methylase Trm5
MVLTDDEADEKAEDYILDSAWAFNADFICRHAGLPYKASEMISSYTAQECEGANDVILAMIKDTDHFVQDAIDSDGRGHFISYYDGKEHEENVFGEWFYIYKVN